MRTYIQKLSIAADKLREREQPLPEIQLVSKALTSLPEAFRIVRSVWASVPPADRTLDHLFQRLLTEENVVKSYQKKDGSSDGAFYSNNGSGKGSGRSGRGRGRGGVQRGFVDKNSKGQYGSNHESRPRCNYCKIVGHLEKDCYKKHGYPGARNENNDKKGSKTDDSFVSSSKFNSKSIFAFFADSGATKHMCDQKGFFSTLKPIKAGDWSVSRKEFVLFVFPKTLLNETSFRPGIGNTKLDVLGVGDINVAIRVNNVTTSKVLHDVLYVAGLGVNLFFNWCRNGYWAKSLF